MKGVVRGISESLNLTFESKYLCLNFAPNSAKESSSGLAAACLMRYPLDSSPHSGRIRIGHRSMREMCRGQVNTRFVQRRRGIVLRTTFRKCQRMRTTSFAKQNDDNVMDHKQPFFQRTEPVGVVAVGRERENFITIS